MILALYSLFVLFTFPILFQRNRFMGMIYAALYLYSAVAVFGYLNLPGYSESLNAYFGDTVGRQALNFIFLSMILIFFISLVLFPRNLVFSGKYIAVHWQETRLASGFALIIILALIALLIAGLISVYTQLGWETAASEQAPPLVKAFIILVKTSVGILVGLYVCIREKKLSWHKILIIPAIIYFILFAFSVIKLGNRTDLAALTVGILYFESTRRPLRFRTLLFALAFIVTSLVALSAIEYARYDRNTQIIDRLVMNDYYAPAHMLFAAIAFKFIDYKEVLISDLSNMAFLLKYPYLQATITDLFNPGLSTRSSSYAFYILTEGFMVAGWFGVLYNAVIVPLYVRLWTALACTNDRVVNLVIQSVLASMTLNLVRAQSSYFVKYTYTYVLPVIIVLSLIAGFRMSFRLRSLQVDDAGR